MLKTTTTFFLTLTYSISNNDQFGRIWGYFWEIFGHFREFCLESLGITFGKVEVTLKFYGANLEDGVEVKSLFMNCVQQLKMENKQEKEFGFCCEILFKVDLKSIFVVTLQSCG